MSSLAIDKAGPRRKVKYGSMSRDRTWALRWSYFFLTLFAIFALVPPIYMLISVPAAFALSRMRFWGSATLATGTFLTYLIPETLLFLF